MIWICRKFCFGETLWGFDFYFEGQKMLCRDFQMTSKFTLLPFKIKIYSSSTGEPFVIFDRSPALHLMGPPALFRGPRVHMEPLWLRLVHPLSEDSFPDRCIVKVWGLWFSFVLVQNWLQNKLELWCWRREARVWLLFAVVSSSCLFQIC